MQALNNLLPSDTISAVCGFAIEYKNCTFTEVLMANLGFGKGVCQKVGTRVDTSPLVLLLVVLRPSNNNNVSLYEYAACTNEDEFLNKKMCNKIAAIKITQKPCCNAQLLSSSSITLDLIETTALKTYPTIRSL